MAHTYASLDEFKKHLVDGGVSDWTASDARILGLLESSSRGVDAHCDRSDFGSGFGPRTGTNRYDGNGRSVLELRDDLLTLTTLTVYDETAGTGTNHTADDDVYLEPYDSTPKRRIIAHGAGDLSLFTRGRRTVDVVGTWGERDQRRTASATASAIADTTTTSVTVSAGAEFSAGLTLLIDSEQLYITAVSGTTLTVKRGQNGTTAATHGAAAAIGIYEYHPDAHQATMLVAQRRMKTVEAGLTGDFGGGNVPVVSNRDSEFSLLRATVGHLRIRYVR